MTESPHIRFGDYLQTSVLCRSGKPEVRILVEDPQLSEAARAFLDTVVLYLTEHDARISDEETLEYGYWLVQFRTSGTNMFDVWEKTQTGKAFQPGVDLTLRYWKEQNDVCSANGSPFDPVRADKLAAITSSVIDGSRPMYGERHESEGDMSGWLIYGPDFSGAADEFRILHLYHLTATVPQLSKFLGLSPDYRIKVDGGDEVWRAPS